MRRKVRLVKPVAASPGRFCCVAPEARFDDARRRTWEDLATVRFMTARFPPGLCFQARCDLFGGRNGPLVLCPLRIRKPRRERAP